MFGRILAGEIQKPSTFSIKTVKLLGDLDRNAAALFRLLCSLRVFIKAGDFVMDVRVPSLGGNAASNSLQSYGLSFNQLNVLHEYGLIIPEYHSYVDYRMCIADENKRVAIPFVYQNVTWGLLPTAARSRDQDFRLHGVSFSRSGKELAQIVDIVPSEEYTAALRQYFETLGLQMLRISEESGVSNE